MKVTLLTDVLTPNNGVGRAGQTVEMNSTEAHEYIKAGHATAASDDAEALPVDPKPEPAKVLTHETVKDNKKANARETKEDKTATDTK